MSVYGVGINDIEGLASRKEGYNKRVYTLWCNMLKRCYSEASLRDNPAYEDCEVCDEWKTLSNFVESIKGLPGYETWRDNPNQKISLDKDIRGNGQKLYSPDTCSFVTSEENQREMMTRNNPNPPRAVMCTFPDSTSRIFDSVSDAARFFGNIRLSTHISQVCKGERRTCQGCKFSYVLS